MNDDLYKFRPAYEKALEDFNRLSHELRGSFESVHDRIDAMLEPIRKAHELTRSLEGIWNSSSMLNELAVVNQRLNDLFRQTTASSRVYADLNLVHRTWLDTIHSNDKIAAQLHVSAKLSLSDVAYKLTVSEQVLSRRLKRGQF